MFRKPLCLGDPWCSEWGCCESDSDKEDFNEPLKKKKAKGKGGKKTVTGVRGVNDSPAWVTPWSLTPKAEVTPPWDRSMILQMAQIYRAPNNHSTISVKVLPVQQQNGYRDCGLFAIAFATEICRGQDPSRAVFIKTQMRGHLFKCLTNRNMMPFPQFPQQEKAMLPPQIALRPHVNTIHVTVHCVCRMPDHYDTNMVQCEACEGWYNYSRMGIKKERDIPKVWKCGYCTQQQLHIQPEKPIEFQLKFPAAKRQRVV